MDTPLVLETDDEVAQTSDSEIISLPKKVVGGTTKIVCEFPRLNQPEDSKIKVSVINHKVIPEHSLVNVDLELGTIVEKGTDEDQKYISVTNFHDKPLEYLELESDADKDFNLISVANLENFGKSKNAIVLANADSFKIIKSPEEVEAGKLTKELLDGNSEDSGNLCSEDDNDLSHQNISLRKRESKGIIALTETPFGLPDLIMDAYIKGNQVNFRIFDMVDGETSTLELRQATANLAAQIRTLSSAVLSDRSLVFVLTAGGCLAVKSSKQKDYLHVVLPNSLDYRYAVYSHEAKAFFVVGTKKQGNATKVTIFKVDHPDEKKLAKESQVTEADVPEAESDDLVLGAYFKENVPSFLLIFGNGRLYQLSQGALKKGGVLFDPSLLRVAEIKSLASETKVPTLYVLLKSAKNVETRVLTLAKVQFN